MIMKLDVEYVVGLKLGDAGSVIEPNTALRYDFCHKNTIQI